MNRILQLQQDRAAHLDAAKAILTKAEAEKRVLTAEERTAFDTATKDAESVTATIDAEQRMAALNGGSHPLVVHDNNADRPFGPEARPGETARERKERLALGFGEQLLAIRMAASAPHRVDPRLLALQERAPAGASEAVPADGGFLVYPEFSNEILMVAHDVGLVYNLARKIPLSEATNAIKIPGIDEQSRADGSRWGGVLMYWQNESDSTTATKPKFRMVELVTKKLMGLYYATDEVLADARALGAIVLQAFGEEMAFKMDDACIRGTGAGQPLGILNAPATVTVSKESGQTATTVNYQNIVKMRQRMWPRSRRAAAWFINIDVEPQLQQLSFKAASGDTAGIPVYLPAGAGGGTFGGASAAPYNTLFGAPVIPLEQCDTLGQLGDIIYADFTQYVTVDKGDMQAAVSMHVRFLTDEQTFRWIYRVDGQPFWHTALTPFKGSNTLSPFVILQART